MNKFKQSAANIFRTGSVVFFTASLFFPRRERKQVFTLYAFVRIFDNFVDALPQKLDEYLDLKAVYYRALQSGDLSKNKVVDNFIALQKSKHFEQSWIDSFFASMEMDIAKESYANISEVEEYMFGSAEVIGLMMSRIMNLDRDLDNSARMLGRAFQYMNMLRDVREDLKLSRVYLPQDQIKKFGLANLSEAEINASPESYEKLIRSEVLRYNSYFQTAKHAFDKMPKRFRIPVMTASEMFNYTVNKIHENPIHSFWHKVSPKRQQVVKAAIKHIVNIPLPNYFKKTS